ncbi:ankyrin repeat domain-containing protein 13C-like [Iris pallida]|uniref:Ankyrin repeat domain-containing protein 13C-like n=1 Tax=Iris pallida TaxID=29817 RepID=A0AAX6H241_IRIPA|nr:ankyrin repeat domain-containing protein 13C-like [Iris pallida]
MEDLSKYSHSPAHLAVLRRDHVGLRRLVTSLPRLPRAGDVATEAQSVAAELVADSVSTVIDRRDVPNRETPLHLAVRLRDAISTEVLVSAGADWSLQNAHGWSALQEAVCTREDSIAMIIARHYQPLAWAKWCRRLPRIVSSISRIRDFYMEITFNFESSVIPFIGRIAPSDTYRIWKQGPNLRADMTLAGFDGFRIQRSDQTFLFLGEGDAERGLPSGSLIVLAHKEKEITNALEGAGAKPTEAEVAHEVALMSQTNMYRPGIDVTQAELVPHLNWRWQERTEMVGNWKGKVYDMLNVMVSVKSRRVPGAMTDEELFAIDNEERMANGGDHDEESDDVLTAEQRKQLDSALRMGDSEGAVEEEISGVSDYVDSSESNDVTKEKKSWFGWNNKRASKSNGCLDTEDPKMSKKFSKLAPENGNIKSEFGKCDVVDVKKGKEKNSGKKKKNGVTGDSNKQESEYKKGLRPVLWLTPDFPLKTDELLPVLDVLANKVKAIRRLRELLTTKMPQGTFPVKVAIPIVPTIRVLVTFTKFEELPPVDEFATPLSSPTNFQDSKGKDIETSGSWYSWVRGSRGGQSTDSSESRSWKDEVDPFHIPPDYTWIDANEKKRRMKAKKVKSRRGASKKQASRSAEGHQLTDGLEE